MQKSKIMIIEDYRPVLDTLKDIINKREDMEVIETASNATEAIEKIKNNEKIQIILIDFQLPEKSGIDVIADINQLELDKNLHFLMLTANRDYQTYVKAEAYGVESYMIKPIRIETIINEINKISDQILKTEKGEKLNKIEKCIGDLLEKLNISKRLNSYFYIRDGILILLKRKNLNEEFKIIDLYREIASERTVSIFRIRNAINKTIKLVGNSDKVMLKEIFHPKNDNFYIIPEKEFFFHLTKYVKNKHSIKL